MVNLVHNIYYKKSYKKKSIQQKKKQVEKQKALRREQRNKLVLYMKKRDGGKEDERVEARRGEAKQLSKWKKHKKDTKRKTIVKNET